MIPIAAIEGQLVFLIVFAVIGVVNWLFEQRKKGSGSPSPQPPAAPRQPSGGAGNDSEQERLRRFMEALGVPQPKQSQPQPQRQTPATQQPRPFRGTTIAPARVRQPQLAKPAPRVIRQPQTRVVIAQAEMARAGRIEEAASSVERISGEFSAMNVKVEMPPAETLERPAHLATANAGTTSVVERGGNPLVATLRRTLTNPADIRAAFLAAELLGPPRGLQS